MKRKILSLIALILLLTSVLAIPANATDIPLEQAATIMPRYVNIIGITASINVNSSGKASCYAFVETSNTSHTNYLAICLQRYKDGTWTTIKSWDTSGTGEATLDKSWYVTPGYYYRTAATATIYTSGGSYVEMATIHSQSDYY